MSDLIDLLRSRRTVHEYRPEPIPDGCIERALAAAIAAPNHHMTEPWRFRRVGPYTRDQLLDVYLDIKRKKAGNLTDKQEERLRAKFTTAAQLLVVSRVRNDDHVTAREDYAAVACAVQNLMLALHAEGVGTKWTTGAVTRDPRTYDLTEVDFDLERIEGFIWVGIAADGDKPKRRLRPGDILRELP